MPPQHYARNSVTQWRFPQGKPQMEGTASICTAFSPDTTLKKCHKVLTDGQPQTQAVYLTSQTRIDPVEVFKDAFPVPISNAQSEVTHTDFLERRRVVRKFNVIGHLFGWRRTHNHVDSPSRWRVADGIFQQVPQDLAHASLIPFDRGNVLDRVPTLITALHMKSEVIMQGFGDASLGDCYAFSRQGRDVNPLSPTLFSTSA